MNQRVLLQIVAPTILISLLLFGLGVFAAWNVQRQQATSSEVLALEIHNILAAESLLLTIPDLRQVLQHSARTDDVESLKGVDPILAECERRVAEMRRFARTEEERQIVSRLAEGCRALQSEVRELIPVADDRDREARIEQILERSLKERLLKPARSYAEANRRVADRTTETNRATADQMRQGFILLGVCGGAAGLVAGLAIARAVGRTILQLDVSVRSAAERLKGVVKPVTISPLGGFVELQHGFDEIESHIGEVVDRLQQREIEILRQQQLASVGQLAAGMAHELRNPLMPVKMLVQKALRKGDANVLTLDQLSVIHLEIQRLESLIDDFLDYARPPTLNRRAIDLVGVVRQTVDVASPRARAQHVELVTNLPDDPVEVDGDSARLQQVLLNLYLNALDLQTNGGRIELDIERRHAEDASANPVVQVRVRDDGPGIRADVLNRLFEPFVSSKETGIGLGLTISHRIIADHGGVMTAHNDPGGGAVFEIQLPVRSRDDAVSRTNSWASREVD